jgi:aspartate aminotransferase
MPNISSRGQAMPASPIRKLVPYAEGAKARGTKVYHLNIGQPDIPTPVVALDAVKNMKDKVIEYSHSAGNDSYRVKLAAHYQSIDIKVNHEEILITTGGSEALLFTFISCFNPGEELIVPEPFYANYLGFATAVGVNIKPIPSRIENGFALPPVSEFERIITPKTKGILICNPNNPTGYLYTKDELEQLRDLVKKYDLYLISDEVYREFCYDGKVHYSAMHLTGIENNVVMVDSISKRYSACGIRIGAMVTKNKLVRETALKIAQSRLSPPSFGQVAGEAALDTPPEYFKEVYDEYIQRRDYLVEALNKIPGVVCPTPKGAFYTMAKLPVDDSDKFSQWLLSDFSYQGQTVMMAPASGFYSTLGLGKDEVRIAYVLKIEDLKNAVKCLEEALKIYPGRK